MALDCYMKMKGIQGECLDAKFRTKGAIQVMSVAFNGATPPDRQANSSISGLDESAWVSDLDFDEGDPDDPDDLRAAFRMFEEPKEPTKPKEPLEWPFTITITKLLDSASPQLFVKYCQYFNLTKDQTQEATETQIEACKIWVRKSSGGTAPPYMIWHFKQIQIISFLWRSLSDGNVEETITFRFRYCRMEYSPQKADGTLGTALFSAWDLQTNKADAPAIDDATVGV